MKQIYPVYPKYIEIKLYSFEYDDWSNHGYVLTTPHFEDYKYGKDYLLLKEIYIKILSMQHIIRDEYGRR